MKKKSTTTLNPRSTFWKCGACSHAMFHLINHEFNHSKEQEEKASDLLAGGIAQKGYQCGMLWGGSLAAGTEAFHRFPKKNEAIVASINASEELVKSFTKRSNTVNCREITKVNWESKKDLAIYMVKTILRGFVYNPCFNLIVKWTPEAIQATEKGLSTPELVNGTCLSCASEVVTKMGGTEEEAMMVAGFAGGIGLSGNACGALSAAIWYKMLKWGQNNQKKNPAMFNNPDAKKLLRTFYIQTDSEMLCSNIVGRKFKSVAEHSDYIKNGGCRQLIDALSIQ